MITLANVYWHIERIGTNINQSATGLYLANARSFMDYWEKANEAHHEEDRSAKKYRYGTAYK